MKRLSSAVLPPAEAISPDRSTVLNRRRSGEARRHRFEQGQRLLWAFTAARGQGTEAGTWVAARVTLPPRRRTGCSEWEVYVTTHDGLDVGWVRDDSCSLQTVGGEFNHGDKLPSTDVNWGASAALEEQLQRKRCHMRVRRRWAMLVDAMDWQYKYCIILGLLQCWVPLLLLNMALRLLTPSRAALLPTRRIAGAAAKKEEDRTTRSYALWQSFSLRYFVQCSLRVQRAAAEQRAAREDYDEGRVLAIMARDWPSSQGALGEAALCCAKIMVSSRRHHGRLEGHPMAGLDITRFLWGQQAAALLMRRSAISLDKIERQLPKRRLLLSGVQRVGAPAMERQVVCEMLQSAAK